MEECERPKSFKLDTAPLLKEIVIEKLESKWSPDQISGWLRISYPENPEMWISHETIYKSLYIRSRKLLDSALMNNLRVGHKMRQSMHHSREGDLITGSGNTHLATLVDRKPRYTIILKLTGKDAGSVNSALIAGFNSMPLILKKSLTWDRGMELAKHEEFTEKTGVPVYFCDPQSPWQRGTNENTNRLLRQYLPKKTCLKKHTQKELDAVAIQLNNRLRKTLGYKTPEKVILHDVAFTG